jgi:hypothetical protein
LIRPDLVIARLKMIQERLPETSGWAMPEAPAVPEQFGLDMIEDMAVKTGTTLAGSVSVDRSAWTIGIWRLDRSIKPETAPSIWINWWQPLLMSLRADGPQDVDSE